MKQVHPVFIAQHATGTCCRGCLERIHHIEKNKELSAKEIDYIVKVIMMWIKNEMNEQVESMFLELVKQFAAREGVTEQLKDQDQMLWVQRMNNIRDRVNEIVNHDLFFA